MSGAGAAGRAPAATPKRRRPDQLPGGHHGLSPEEVAASQRTRIVEALRASIAEHGYSEASVADVIKRAGVSRKTFYAQFADKEECFLEIYGERMGRLEAVVADAFGSQDEWVASLRAGIAALLNALALDPAAARLCFVDVLAAGPRAAEARTAAMRTLEATLELTRGAAGDGTAPRALGMSMVGGLGEVLYQEIVGDRTAELPALLPELMYALVLPFAGRDAAERELTRPRRR
ncbi:MAG: TetR/AcrR family transcriptional regulator [Solirubrobacterales bacterium]|nr:TetR/AcrR family transcriptional regulator [Solirubrobacterales bacterium]